MVEASKRATGSGQKVGRTSVVCALTGLCTVVDFKLGISFQYVVPFQGIEKFIFTTKSPQVNCINSRTSAPGEAY